MGVAHPVRIPRAARAASGTRARCILREFPPSDPRDRRSRDALFLAHALLRRGRLRRFGRRRGSAPRLRREGSSWVPPRSGLKVEPRQAGLESRLRGSPFQPSAARNPTCPSVSCVFPEPVAAVRPKLGPPRVVHRPRSIAQGSVRSSHSPCTSPLPTELRSGAARAPAAFGAPESCWCCRLAATQSAVT